MDIPIHTAIRTYKLNRKSLDAKVEPKISNPQEPIKEDVARYRSVIYKLPKEMKTRGFETYISYNCTYRGLPERVLIVDKKAPFSEDWANEVDTIFQETAGKLRLSYYEPEDIFIDTLKRIL